MTKLYTACGDTKIPPHMKEMIKKVAIGMAGDGFTLRNTGMAGAEEAFIQSKAPQEVILPWHGFNNHRSPFVHAPDIGRTIAFNHVPRFGYLSDKEQQIKLAKIQSLFGTDLKSKSEVVIMYSFSDMGSGGVSLVNKSGEADDIIRIAKAHQIPVINLAEMGTAKLSALLGVSV